MLRYTLMRLGIFAGCLVVVWGLVYAGVFLALAWANLSSKDIAN